MGFLNRFFGKKEAPIQTYADFWHWFAQHEKTFAAVVKSQKNIEKDFFNPLDVKLSQLKDRCFYYLVGMLDAQTVDFVLSAEGNVKNIAFVEALVNAAPKLDGWKFTALKPSVIEQDNFKIGMAGVEFAESNIFFYENESDHYPDEIDITFVHAEMHAHNQDAIKSGIHVFLDNYLGELVFAEAIDHMQIVSQADAKKPLRAIKYLKDYLQIRQKQFVEKYQGTRKETDLDEYSLLEANLKSGNVLIATVNTRLLGWDAKASHPWIAVLEMYFDGSQNNGMPSKADNDVMYDIEDDLMRKLIAQDGYLNVGRQTAEGVREIYFACRDFRLPALVFYALIQQYDGKLRFEYEICKDKYWKTFERYRP